MCNVRADSPGSRPERAEAAYPDTPPELIFPPQYPFSWTLRGARAQRLRAKKTPAGTRYRATGWARDEAELAAVLAFCEEHGARFELG
jgi:hypothetical protein